MRTKLLLTISSLTLLGGFAHAGPDEQGIDALLKRMSFDEKISMLSGDSTGFNAPGIERLGIPTLYMSDGPVGVRSGKATAYPVTIGMAASWDANEEETKSLDWPAPIWLEGRATMTSRRWCAA